MKTRVNLLTPDLLPPELLISLERLAQVVVIVLLLGGSLNAWFYFQNDQLTTELSQHKQTNGDLKTRTKDLEQRISNHKPDARLVAQVAATDEKLQVKQRLLDELDRRSDITSEGFSTLMTDLAGVTAPKLWLTSFQAENQRFNFEGYSVQAQTVPFWVEQLRTTETLRGYAFSAINMEREPGLPISFTLSSKPEEKATASSAAEVSK